nr:unnamed protein product [Callosobruchus chinensis]CAH7719116.1 unnamed protein product [Callosobruchus chinensis]CAH7720179.1 unnamed protein product [Callosobruchus chinensis]CAH7725582.1 unnamed protein product [Callosobruchus chinensis]CAH7725596.1 unnamed protein product [Callosobruchus chinensis]
MMKVNSLRTREYLKN